MNIRTARYESNGKLYHLSNWDGETLCTETGNRIGQTRRDFLKLCKTIGAVIDPIIKTGQYIDLNGNLKALFGINNE